MAEESQGILTNSTNSSPLRANLDQYISEGFAAGPWDWSAAITNAKGEYTIVGEVDPIACPKCGGTMKDVAFITEYAVVDRIIDLLKLKFVADKPPPSHVFKLIALMAAEARTDYFLEGVVSKGGGGRSS